MKTEENTTSETYTAEFQNPEGIEMQAFFSTKELADEQVKIWAEKKNEVLKKLDGPLIEHVEFDDDSFWSNGVYFLHSAKIKVRDELLSEDEYSV